MDSRPTLVFTAGGFSWFQLLVKVTTLSRVDHVAIGVGNMLLHAREDGVVLEPRASWLRSNRVVDELEIIPDVSRGVLRCLSLVGDPYDRIGVLRTGLGLALRRTMSLVKPWPAAVSGAHTCAGFAMLLDPHGELIPEWRGVSRRSVVPDDLHRRLGESFRPKIQPFAELC